MKKLILLFFVCTCVFASAQSQITWDMGLNIASNNYGNLHPRIALDGTGNPMVIWGRMSDESVFFSRWNGTSFTLPYKLNPTGFTIATASWMGPDLASKGDTVYVVVKRTPESSDTNHIYIISSFDGGITFLPPVRVDFIADSISRFPTVSIDATGNPIVAFMKFNSSFLQSRWVVAKSSDYGKTFSTDVKASGWSSASSEVCDCCPGAIVSSGAFSAMIYRDNLSNIRDIWTGISTTNNASFKSGFGVDNNKWKINSCPSSGPDGVIIGDSLYSVFMSSGSGNLRTYLSKSSISSGEVGTVLNLTSSISGLSQQNYPRIANYGNAMAIVWKQTINGSAQLPLLFTNNIANGFPTIYDMVDMYDNTNADVAISNSRVFVVWQDDYSGAIKYRSGIYIPSSTFVSENEQNDFSFYPSPVSDILTIQFASSILANPILTVTNTIGETILSQSIGNTNISTLNIKDLVSGVYFIQIKSGNKLYIQKFIKK